MKIITFYGWSFTPFLSLSSDHWVIGAVTNWAIFTQNVQEVFNRTCIEDIKACGGAKQWFHI